jgi:hypothetical protein
VSERQSLLEPCASARSCRASSGKPSQRRRPFQHRTNGNGIFLVHRSGGSSLGDEAPIGTEEKISEDKGWGFFSLLSAGVDYLVTDHILLGLALHSDHLNDPAKGSNVQFTGVLVGPYASVALSPSLYLDASLFYGQSWNTLDMGELRGDFDPTRFTATTKLEGLLDLRAAHPETEHEAELSV